MQNSILILLVYFSFDVDDLKLDERNILLYNVNRYCNWWLHPSTVSGAIQCFILQLLCLISMFHGKAWYGILYSCDMFY